MGRITAGLLDLMEIPWGFFPTEEDQLDSVMDRVEGSFGKGVAFALVMRKGSIAPFPAPDPFPIRPHPDRREWSAAEPTCTRGDALQVIQDSASSSDVIVATTGYTGRELYSLDDRPNHFYMVGSMGCLSSLALGLAIAKPDLRVIALDGDGAALMRMGALATIGFERPPNLVHVLLDNAVHESTGGQSTVSRSLDWCRVAQGCGYPGIHRTADTGELERIMNQDSTRATFVHVPLRPGTPELPRPSLSPAEVAERLRIHLQSAP